MFAGRVYSGTLNSIPITAATAEDLVEMNPAADQPICLIGLVISQADDSGDSGDSNEDVIDIIISRITGAPTSGSGGSAPTATPTDTGMTAYGGTLEMGNTTNLTGGTEVVWHREGINNRVGMFYWPPPEARLGIRGDETLLIKTSNGHTNAHELNVVVYFAEFG